MTKHLVLIAPRGIHLETSAKALAEKLKRPLHSPHDFSDDEWKSLGFNMKTEILAFAKGGAYEAYCQKVHLRIATVAELLANPNPSIIILPPDYVVYESPENLALVQQMLREKAHVILLTATPDSDENARLLDADLSKMTDWSEVNAYWVRHPSNEKLAKHQVYTAGRTEQETCDEILALADKNSEIILIGPKLTGKTTLGFLLAEVLGLPQVSLDTVGWGYLEEISYDSKLATEIFRADGIFAWLKYSRPFEAYIVERTLQDYKHCVIDFGGGHSVYDAGEYFDRVAAALAPYPNVFLILPSADKEEAIRILAERWQKDFASEQRLHRLLITHSSFSDLADDVIYTKGKSEADLQIELEQRLR
jgi:shikimate kinase